MNHPRSCSEWIAHVFDHAVSDPAWHWGEDAPAWEGSAADTAVCVAETFERAGELLARFTDAQLNQGFWYLASASCSDFMFCLTHESVPEALRLRALRSFVPLFEQVMARRCSAHLSHLDEQPANPLNSVCYMWWDILPVHGEPDRPERAAFDAEVLQVLGRLLKIPHDACRESALHGLGEWQIYDASAADLVEAFLEETSGLRPELVAYALRARDGMVQ